MAHQPQSPAAPLTWIEWRIYLAMVLACAVAFSPNLADADLWGHVQHGRDALQHGLSTTTTHSYTADGYRWINHENLAELILATGGGTCCRPDLARCAAPRPATPATCGTRRVSGHRISVHGRPGLRGNLVVAYNWAQYAISVFCSKQPGRGRMRVGFDGRFRTCYPQEVVDMHFDFVLGNDGPEYRWRGPESPQFNPCHVLQFKQPDLVLISRLQTHAVQFMDQQQDHWALIYQDELAQLSERAARYDDSASEHYLPVTRRHVSNEPQLGSVPCPALPQFIVPDRTFATADKTSDHG